MAQISDGLPGMSTLDQKSPYGAKPSQVDQPIPMEQQQAELAQDIAGAPVGDSEQTNSPELQALLDAENEEVSPDLQALLDAESSPGQPSDLPRQENFPVEEEPVGLINRLSEDIGMASARLKASFAVNDKETKSILSKIYGQENVKRKDGDFYVKLKNSKSYRKFDSDQIEIISDTLDGARMAIEEAVATGGTVLGAGAGAVVGGMTAGVPGIGAGAILGGAAGRLASTPLQIKWADAVGEYLGVEHDADRSLALESAVSGAINLTLPLVGRGLGRIANKGVEKFTKGKNLLKRQIKGGNLRHVKPTAVELSEDSAEILKYTDELRQSGIIQNIPGTNTPLAIWQVHPDAPESLRVLGELSNEPTVINAMNQQAAAFKRVTKDLLQKVGDIKGAKTAPGGLGKVVTNIAKTVREAEGQQIGFYRAKAMQKLGRNSKVQFNETVRDNAEQLLRRMGYNFKSIRTADGLAKIQAIPPKDIKSQLGALGLTKESQFQSMANILTEIQDASSKGGLNLLDYEKTIEKAGDRMKLANQTGGNLKKLYGGLMSNLRTSRNEAVMSGLDNEAEKQAYKQVSDRFSKLLDTSGSLARTLDDNISSRNFVRDIFNQGKAGLEHFRAAKALLKEEHPDTWRRITGDFLDELIDSSGSSDRLGVNTGKVLTKLRGLGKEMTEELFDGTGTKLSDFKKLLMVGERLRKQNINVKSPEAIQKAGDQMVGAVAGTGYIQARSLMRLFGFGRSKNTMVLEALDQQGIDKFLGNVPHNKKEVVRKMWLDAIAYAKANKIMNLTSTGTQLEAREGLGN